MKLKINRQEIIFYGLQVAAWLVFLMVPAISAFITTHSWTDSLRAFDYNARIHWISAAIYFVNSLILIQPSVAVLGRQCTHPGLSGVYILFPL